MTKFIFDVRDLDTDEKWDITTTSYWDAAKTVLKDKHKHRISAIRVTGRSGASGVWNAYFGGSNISDKGVWVGCNDLNVPEVD